MTRVRHALALAGFMLALTGVALAHRTIIWIALGVLGASAALRVFAFLHQRRNP